MKMSRESGLSSIGSLYHVGGAGLTHPLDANSFVIPGDFPVLVDCGTKKGWPQLKQNLGRVGVKAEKIGAVLATHCDYDHIDAFEPIAKESDAILFVPTKDMFAVKSGDNRLTEAVYYGETATPMPDIEEVYPGFCLRLGKIAISAIETPWHTQGSVSYRIDQPDSTTLLTGDAVDSWYFLNRSQDIDEDVRMGRESFRRLREGRYDAMGTGHLWNGFRGDVDTRLEETARRFAPPSLDIQRLVEEAIMQQKIYINLFHKMDGQNFRY